MRKIITFLTLMLISTIGIAQTDSVRGNQFELEGKIISEVHRTAKCGTFAWATVVEFEINKFSDKAYKDNSIAVIFTCPDIYEDNFFEVGKTYTLILADENQADFEWMIVNESALKKYKLDKPLWVVEAKKK